MWQKISRSAGRAASRSGRIQTSAGKWVQTRANSTLKDSNLQDATIKNLKNTVNAESNAIATHARALSSLATKASGTSTGGNSSSSTSVPSNLGTSSSDNLFKNLGNQKTIVSRAANGMRIASQNCITDSTVTVGIWIDAGSRYETKQSNGVAHFLEHITFKGTNRRTRLQLETEIENMGGHLNAYTSREQTVYYAKVFKEDLDRGIDILSDILLKSTLLPQSINNERNVILREMAEVEKTTEEVIFDRLHLTAFRDYSLGFTILGPVENIQNIEDHHLKEYIQKNYTTDRMVVVAVGAVDHDELVDVVNRYFKDCRLPDPERSVSNSPYIPSWFNYDVKEALEATETGNNSGEVNRVLDRLSKMSIDLPEKPEFQSAELLYDFDVDSPIQDANNGSAAGIINGNTEPSGINGNANSVTGAHGNSQLAHFAVAWEGVSWTSSDVVSFMLMQSIFGSFRREESQKILGAAFSANPVTRSLANRLDLLLLDELVEASKDFFEGGSVVCSNPGSSPEVLREEPDSEPVITVKVRNLEDVYALSEEDWLQWQQEAFAVLQSKGTASMPVPFEPAVCESFSAFNTCYKDCGLFGIYGSCTPRVLRLTIEELMHGIQRLKYNIEEEEVESAKRELKLTLFGNLDNTTAVAEDVGRHLLCYGRRIPPEEMCERIDRTDAAEVMRVAQKYLHDKISMTALGPKLAKNMPPLEEIKEMNRMM